MTSDAAVSIFLDMNIRQMLLEFHRVMEIDSPDFPLVPPTERVRKAVRLVVEEFVELLEATYGHDNTYLATIKEDLHDMVDYTEPAVDLVETADALADIAYVTESAFQSFGIDSEPVLVEVHRSNMAKLGGGRRDDGKILKPEGWTAPDIDRELARQIDATGACKYCDC